MKVLLDTNIILDQLLEREPFYIESNALFDEIRLKRVIGYVTATTLTDIFYIAKKQKGTRVAQQYIRDLLMTMQICPVNRKILEAAIASNSDDFEDAVQLACAVSEGLDAIVTRNMQGFSDASIDILTAGELLTRLSSETRS
ncbi:PIN domain-containing protein [Limnoraphis robusta Tam1]|uniref:PIN domain-containing protein n=1 Tax=Limnoraphis robusta CCNP1315 TaxID=3110306 RepID=A0ABU5U0R0_9CYAN|nr:PIN domain-containing protein [Limnoraphis robusta]MEA5497909.1 PIN domain-containing protein [Limnoraphis robusta BA-68 BA1]MEA5520763.1 PIN domain-containing protein [Limnoraphis robusta CCNP1315]MEA5539998.1 PIN domain-containing protein [Limnoraphis robusta Tam1]MEA5549236.1 PIN domain-containing protein [Limnoraphis robusta CCNP1324]